MGHLREYISLFFLNDVDALIIFNIIIIICMKFLNTFKN
jgi:hypothetical protein